MRTFAISLLLLAASAGPVRADMIYSNFLSTNPAYDHFAGPVIENASGQNGAAFRFQNLSPYDMYLTSIQLAVTFQSGTPQVTIGIAADNQGLPGTLIDLQTVNLQAAFVNGIDDSAGYFSEISTFFPAQNDSLLHGSTYWVLAFGDGQSSLFWNYNTFGPNGGVNDSYARLVTDFSQDPPVDIWTNGVNTQGAFEVNGIVTPEPSSFMMLGAAALTLCFARLRIARATHPARTRR